MNVQDWVETVGNRSHLLLNSMSLPNIQQFNIQNYYLDFKN
jgi:hypothetical protein